MTDVQGEGSRAQELLDDPVLDQAFTDVKQDFIDAIVATGPEDIEGMQKAKICIHLVDKVREKLERKVKNAKLDAHEDHPILQDASKLNVDTG